MELDTPHGKGDMTQRVDLARIIGRGRDHFERGGKRLPLDDQRVIPSDHHRRGDATEQARPVVRDARGLAVHGASRAHHATTVGFTDRLMSEADAECGNALAPRANHVDRDAGLRGGARAGRQHDRIRREGADLLDRDRVVATDDDLRTELAEVLDEIVREGVVVVDDEQHGP
jgi:hypothetical protein